MASAASRTIAVQTGTSATNSTPAVGTQQNEKDFIFVVTTSNESSVNHSLQLEHSVNGIDWVSLGSPIVANANATQSTNITGPIFPQLRVTNTVTAGSADFNLRVLFDPNK